MHQVSFAHTHAAIDKKRVVAARWMCSDRPCRGMSELIARAHHETFECELRIERADGCLTALTVFLRQRRENPHAPFRPRFIRDARYLKRKLLNCATDQGRELGLEPH